MKKTKLLIPSLLVASIAPTVSLVGCSNAVTINWDSDKGPYVYQSKLHDETTFNNFDDATNEYFNTITPFIMAEDIVFRHLGKQENDSKDKKISVHVENIDKVNHKATFDMVLTQYDITPSSLPVILKRTYTKVPLYLLRDIQFESDGWFLLPKGISSFASISPKLSEELKNDHGWSFKCVLTQGEKILEDVSLNHETKDGDFGIYFFIERLPSYFFSKVKYVP